MLISKTLFHFQDWVPQGCDLGLILFCLCIDRVDELGESEQQV